MNKNIIITSIFIVIIYFVISGYFNEYRGKIDAVYTWVNGSDPDWVDKRNSFSDKPKNEDAALSIRFENIHELLRSHGG